MTIFSYAYGVSIYVLVTTFTIPVTWTCLWITTLMFIHNLLQIRTFQNMIIVHLLMKPYNTYVDVYHVWLTYPWHDYHKPKNSNSAYAKKLKEPVLFFLQKIKGAQLFFFFLKRNLTLVFLKKTREPNSLKKQKEANSFFLKKNEGTQLFKKTKGVQLLFYMLQKNTNKGGESPFPSTKEKRWDK